MKAQEAVMMEKLGGSLPCQFYWLLFQQKRRGQNIKRLQWEKSFNIMNIEIVKHCIFLTLNAPEPRLAFLHRKMMIDYSDD